MNQDKKNSNYDDVISDLMFQNMKEKKSSRRWNIFFKMIFLFIFIFIFFTTAQYFKKYDLKKSNHVAIIDINGFISNNHASSSRNIIDLLDSAFYNENCKAIILRINSPGGTPVQANIIHDYIKFLRNLKKKSIYSVIEDIGTSGAYLIAISTEKIYCDPSSIVGSIGAAVHSFGFVDTLKKLGIEKRIYKSGKYKNILDPFSEKGPDDDKIIFNTLNVVHDNFASTVKKDRPFIKLCEDELFSGRFWVGREALEIGLVDGFYNIYSFSSDIIKINNLVEYKHEVGLSDFFKLKF